MPWRGQRADARFQRAEAVVWLEAAGGAIRCRRSHLAAAAIALTPRETQVLQLMALGHCNKMIARDLGIGVGTVKTHAKGLFSKLGASARTQAVVMAARRGLVDGQREGSRG